MDYGNATPKRTACHECWERVTDGSWDISLCDCEVECNSVCLLGKQRRREERKHLRLVPSGEVEEQG